MSLLEHSLSALS